MGKVTNPKSDTVNISVPINNVSSFAFIKTLEIDKEGNFIFRHNSTTPGFYNVCYENNITVKLILNPGDTCFLRINTDNGIVNISCNNNTEGLKIYNKLYDEQISLMMNGKQKFRYYTPRVILDTLSKRKLSDLESIQNLFEINMIDQRFFELLSNDISYFYAALCYDLVSNNVFMSQLPDNHPQHVILSKESLYYADSTLSQLFSSFDSNTPNYMESGKPYSIFQDYRNVLSSEYLNLLDKYIHYKGYYIPHRNNSFEIDKVNKNLHQYNLNLYAQNLNLNEFEFAAGNYFFIWFDKLKIAGDLIKPYTNYKKYFPESPFIPYIDPLVKEYYEFDSISTENIPENIDFITSSDTIKSLNALLKLYNDQMLYIDIWATSCPPCLKEFEHYKDLYQFLSANDIQILFISLDKKSDSEHWKKTIIKYNLIGHHILANASLQEDIKKETDMIGIPWYLFKDKEGNIPKEFIYRPSFRIELYKQLSSFINE